MPYLISQTIKKKYIANVCSKPFCFCLAISLFVLLVPFFLAYSTNNFWLNQKFIYVQPEINLQNNITIYSLENGMTYTYSNFLPLFNKKNMIKGFAFQIEKPEKKLNEPEKYRIKISFTSDATNTKSVSIIFIVNMLIDSSVRLAIQSLIPITISSTTGISNAYVYGTLKFTQKELISQNVIPNNIYNKTAFNENFPNSYDIKNILLRDLERNGRIFLKKILGIYLATLNLDYKTLITPGLFSNKTEITIDMIIPHTLELRTIPKLLEHVKFAWVQYFSLLVPIGIIGMIIASYVFNKKIIHTQIIENPYFKLN